MVGSIYWQVEDLKVKLLDKLEQSLMEIELNPEGTSNASGDPSPFSSAHEVGQTRVKTSVS